MPANRLSIDQIDAMANAFRSGQSLAQVGAAFGVSRQRVHQVLTRVGVHRLQGGVQVRNAAKRDAQVTKLAQKLAKQWDMTVDDYTAHVAAYGNSSDKESPMYRYHAQRRAANLIGVPWLFTFRTWWAMWQASGKWAERGRGRDKYVLARIGTTDTPMGPDTCHITTLSQAVHAAFFQRTYPNGRGVRTKRTKKDAP